MTKKRLLAKVTFFKMQINWGFMSRTITKHCLMQIYQNYLSYANIKYKKNRLSSQTAYPKS